MAAVLLVLIFAIADLALTVLKDLEESGLKKDRRYQIVQENQDEKEDWTVLSEVTGSVTAEEDGQNEITENPQPSEKKKAADHPPAVKLVNVSDESLAESMITINGRLEALVDKKVFEVSLPVESTDIEYIADPQGLICQTNASAYADSWFDPASNVYFDRGLVSDEKGVEKVCYTGTSAPFKVVNRSSCAVSVVARIFTGYEQKKGVKVPLAPDTGWEDSKKPSICLSVIRGDDMTETVLDSGEKIIKASVAGCPGAYVVKYEGPENYRYQLMTDEELEKFRKDPKNKDINTVFSSFTLSVKGECNRNGDWDADSDYVFPSVSVIWNVGIAETVKPAVSQKNVSVAGNDAFVISFDYGLLDDAADAVTTAYYITPEGEERDLRWNGYYLVFSEQTVTLTPEFMEYARERGGGVLRLRFNDRSNTVQEITLDKDAPPSLEISEYSIPSGETKPVSFAFDTGTGDKAAGGIASITFGKTDLFTSSYSSVGDGVITLNAGAVRMINDKKGGKVCVTFDDEARTRCVIRFKTEK